MQVKEDLLRVDISLDYRKTEGVLSVKSSTDCQ